MNCIKCGDYIIMPSVSGLRCSECFVEMKHDNGILWVVLVAILALGVGLICGHKIAVNQREAYAHTSR